MTTYITLICANGMSTSLLANKMKEAASKEGLDISLIAMSENSFSSYDGHTDILLLGPQIKYMFDKLKSINEPKGVIVSNINMMDYGMMNGQKVLHDTLLLTKKGEK
jgi:PTS system cellobiose-specific IIB component